MEISAELLEKAKNGHPEFQGLYEEHMALKQKVDELGKLKFLTTEQEIERKQHQKQKLIIKDKIGVIISQYEASLH